MKKPHEKSEEGKIIICICAEGDDTPYSAYGRYYIRLNDADVQMQSSTLQKFFEDKEDTYFKWEQRDSGFGSDDIDEGILLDCIRTANDNGRLDYVYRNASDALSRLGLLASNGNINNAGYCLFGKNRPLTIKEGSFPTDSRTEFGEIKEFSGNIIECMREALSYVLGKIEYKSSIVGVQREDVPEIPIRAIREIVVNSFAHCSYARKGDFNQYTVFRSSVRIYNPGGIIKGIDPKEFASGKVGSKLRNPLISSVLYKFGFADTFGTGFDRVFGLCSSAGVKYDYYNDDFGFAFVFLRSNDKINDKINDVDERMISAIAKDSDITIPRLAKEVGVSAPTVSRHLSLLVASGRVRRVGSRKTGRWKVVG